MMVMAIKPIIDVQYHGKHITVQFARDHAGIAVKYDIVVNDKPVRIGAFAEEVMRWLGEAMHEEPAKSPTTKRCG